jgi:endonuclease III
MTDIGNVNMNERAIRDRLVERGQVLFDAPREKLVEFTAVPEADALLNDLSTHPHAFVLACLMDRQVKYEKAWLIPYKISKKLGGFSIKTLSELSREDVRARMSEPEPLHHFVGKMSGVFYSGVQRIAKEYTGGASRIWSDKPSSAEAVYRFLQFDGAGPKIATMAVNILARDFKIKFADFFSVDISADVHVCRVFARLGLCSPGPEVEQVVYKARALYPVFPGMIDLPCWDIGRKWCKPQNPQCNDCYMNDLCPTANDRPPLQSEGPDHRVRSGKTTL